MVVPMPIGIVNFSFVLRTISGQSRLFQLFIQERMVIAPKAGIIFGTMILKNTP